MIKNWDHEDAFEASKRYLINRVRRFLPVVFWAGLLMLILQLFRCITIYDAAKLIIEFVFQISFVSQLFPTMRLGAGGIFWFLSASMIGGTVLICICKSVGKKVVFMLPLLSAVIFNIIYNHVGNMDVWHTEVFCGIVGDSLLRATADISIGIVAKEMADSLKKSQIKKCLEIIAQIINIVLVMIMIYVSLYFPHSRVDFYGIIVFAVIIIVANISDFGQSNFITDYADKICMPMYAFQVASIMIVSSFTEATWLSGIGVLLFDFMLSFIWILAESKINRYIYQRK